jgi:hypothetical protein
MSTARPKWSSALTSGRGWGLLAALCAAIIAWQSSFNSVSLESRRPYAMNASMGLCPDAFYFFYFFHHYGVYPVGALEVPRLGPTRREADRFVAEHGDRLRMDFGWPVNTPRFGDHGKLFLFCPDVLVRGDPGHPSAIPFNEILFIVSLVALVCAFWREGHGLLGALIVLLVGSDPFQILETYGRGNVFSIPISVTVLALATHLRFLTRRAGVDAIAWGIALASGVALASVREVRAEAAVVAASVLATYLTARAPFLKRSLLAAAFLAALVITGLAWTRYWTDRFAQAERFVTRSGGEVFRPSNDTHHAFWHAIACGLGDFGADRGFQWDDQASFRWATTRDPVSNPDPIPFHYVRGYYLEETYDGVHHVAPTDLPEYNRLVRSRVLTEIRHHPWWYAGVLLQRLLAIQRDATPAALSLGSITIGVPGAGWLTAPVLLFLLWRRRYLHASLVLFVLPLSAVALLVYSGKGMTFYGIAHLVALAAAIDLLVRFARAGAVAGTPHVA